MLDEQLTALMKMHPYRILHTVEAGSRGYGYATDLSDYDVHSVHLLSLEHMLGFEVERGATVEMKQPPIDLATHDLKKFLQLLYKGNGNILEDLYNRKIIFTSPIIEEIKELAKGCITKKVANHYKGMAYNQQHRMQEDRIKGLMHTYRCLLMGIHCMREGEIDLNVPKLVKMYRQSGWEDLYALKITGAPLADEEKHLNNLEKLHVQLVEEQEQSKLPEKPKEAVKVKLEQMLIACRKQG